MMENQSDRTLNYRRFGLVMGKPKRNPLTVFRKLLVPRTVMWGSLGLGRHSPSDLKDSSGSSGAQAKARVRTAHIMYMCISLCTVVAHNTAQNSSDNLPCYLPDNHHCS